MEGRVFFFLTPQEHGVKKKILDFQKYYTLAEIVEMWKNSIGYCIANICVNGEKKKESEVSASSANNCQEHPLDSGDNRVRMKQSWL